MPITKMNVASNLTNPNPVTAPLLQGISGRSNTTQPLTARSYKIIEDKLRKNHKVANANLSDKFSTFIDRAVIPRAIASKMADLTESYSNQMWDLVDAAMSIEKDEDEPYGPELEGIFEKSKAMAKRFQQSFDAIQNCFKLLEKESTKVSFSAINSLMSANIDQQTKQQSLDTLCKRSGIKYNIYKDIQGETKIHLKPTLVLLPLIKGISVYRNRLKTLNYLTEYTTKKNNSSERIHKTNTTANTTIEILHQVQPKMESQVFSDHAGFIAKFSTAFHAPLYVYYHSLEHGYQHTSTRTAWNFGAQSSFSAPIMATRPDANNSEVMTLSNPRAAYIEKLHEQLRYLFSDANPAGDVLVIVGECTDEIHNGILDLVLKKIPSPTNQNQLVRIAENTVNVYGAPTQAPHHELKFVNASKVSRDSKHKILNGLGVHALTAYMFYNTQLGQRTIPSIEPHLLTLTDKTEQNILTVSYGPQNELHAFTHLLNKKEDALANELKVCGYESVGGDLNNITVGTDLVQTVNKSGTFMSTGSNSVATTMYDKIVLL